MLRGEVVLQIGLATSLVLHDQVRRSMMAIDRRHMLRKRQASLFVFVEHVVVSPCAS